MTDAEVLAVIDEVRAKADAGVDYSARWGAVCPVCGKARMQTVTSRPWKNGIKIRYHKCNNLECLVCRIGLSLKSYQNDDS